MSRRMAEPAVSPLLWRRTNPMFARGTTMNVVSWLLLAVVICTLIARFVIKLLMKTRRRKLGLDDVFVSLSALFSIGQTIAVSIESMEVLGQHVGDLSAHQTAVYQKAEYAACILHIANMGCARISVCLLIKKILPGMVQRYTTLVFAGLTAIWTVVGVLVTAFSCSTPDPWAFVWNKRCIDVLAFVNYVGITNIVSEILLILLPLAIWNVQMSKTKTAMVSLVFMARLSVVGALSAQLYFLNHAKHPDFSYNFWSAALCQQIAQNLAVICACLPYFHPFIISLLAQTDDHRTIISLTKWSEKHPPSDCASTSRLTQQKTPESYCRPLNTWGLDDQRHSRSHGTSPFPQNIAKPIFTPHPPQNVFNRPIHIPAMLPLPLPLPPSRPLSTHTSTTDPLSISMPHVGVLPFIEWESESSSDSSRKNSSRNSGRNSGNKRSIHHSEYHFDRQKVVSWTEGEYAVGNEDGEGGREVKPPPPPLLRPVSVERGSRGV